MAGVVRQPIDVARLSSYLSIHVPSLSLPIEVHQFGYGQSNPTYRLRTASGEDYVLRKKPPGGLLSKSAHQVEREYRIIRALEKTDIPVPKTYCLCQDAKVIGSAFYIMECLHGRIFEDAAMPDVTPCERTAMWREAVRVLARLHGLEPESVGLGNYGKSSGFYSRQLRTLSAIAVSQAGTADVETGRQVGNLPHFNETVAFLAESEPFQSGRSTLIHGDFKIDNLVYHETEPKIIGILDWEMSTIGHPVSDLSNLFTPFLFANAGTKDGLQSQVNEAFRPGARIEGLPSQAQCLEWYGEMAGWDPTNELRWGNIFATFRNGVIMQGIAARFAKRQASSERAKAIGELMQPYGDFTGRLIDDWRNDHPAGPRTPKL